MTTLEEQVNKYKSEEQSIDIFKPIALKDYEDLSEAQENIYIRLNELQQQHNDLFKLFAISIRCP